VEENLGVGSPYDLELLISEESPLEDKEKAEAEQDRGSGRQKGGTKQNKIKDSRRVISAA